MHNPFAFRVYLAGPTVFHPGCEAIFSEMRAICADHGLVGVAPIDGQADLIGIPPGRELYNRIVCADFALMDGCDAGIVCLDPFHGDIEMDAGTAVEIGYMYARRKIMSGWTVEPRLYGDRIRERLGPTSITAANSSGATSGAERDASGFLIHSADLNQHGMAQIPIERSGGRVWQSSDWRSAFRDCAREISYLLDLVDAGRG